MVDPTYRAVVCEALGAPESLRLQHLARQPLLPGAVRVSVKAAGINFPDLLTIEGLYQHRPQPPFTPGVEAAGIVVEMASNVRGLFLGQRVIVRMRTGGYAEEAMVPASQVVPMPQAFTFAEAATLLVAHGTAYHGLVSRGGLAEGQKLLVLGAGGGVGLAAVQVGKAIGARILAAASSAPKLEAAISNGAHEAIDYSREPVEVAVKRLTAGAGVDVVLDPVGIEQAAVLRCLAHGGKLLIAGFAGGSIPAYAANRILLKGCSVIGVRAGEAGRQDPALRRSELDAVLTLAAQGLVRPRVSARFPLPEWAAAMRLLRSRKAIGRVALEMDAA
ncbi:MAG: NADPH:quinone oxidoreductase family protein [Hyphomicrobiaceae bacterium]|nr:NADPH:quinone oxidoreductase family protein [Hyphomicrobiaceae bacterium]